MSSSPLTIYEQAYLNGVRALIAGDPPAPWQRAAVVSAAGVILGGWTAEEHVLVVSHDGYSVTNAVTGERLIRDHEVRSTYDAISRTGLLFRLPQTGEPVTVFGIYGGNGVHVTEDGWEVETVCPWWPRAEIIMRTPWVQGSQQSLLERSHMLSLRRLMPERLWCGFAPSGRHLMILGSSGAEVFTR